MGEGFINYGDAIAWKHGDYVAVYFHGQLYFTGDTHVREVYEERLDRFESYLVYENRQISRWLDEKEPTDAERAADFIARHRV